MTEELKEQPVEDSTTEQSNVEASEVDQVEDQSTEDQTIVIDGNSYSPSEIKEGFMRQEDYTRKTQELSKKRQELEQPSLPQDKQAILDELKSLGVVTKADLDQQKAVLSQQAKDDSEIKSLKLTPSQEKALRGYASLQDNLSKSMTECWDELNSALGGNVVARKQNIKPKAGNRGGGFQPMPNHEVAKLPDPEYKKYWAEYAAWKASNNS
jgi:hypothetical protein